MWEGLKIGGFQFDDSMEYALAKKESDIIGYITERMNINDPQVALLVYYKLLERQDMKTVVGLSFLKQLRDYCVESGVVEDSQIKMIPIRVDNGAKGKLSSFGDEEALETDSAIQTGEEALNGGFEKLDNKISEEFSTEERQLKREKKEHADRERKLKAVADHYKNKAKKCYYIISALAVVILILFIMAVTSGNTPFSDAEKDLQDRYAGWAEELSAREEAIKVREQQINGGDDNGYDQSSDS
ncbi:MAG: hypothetical protein IKS98_11190 [Lachnospiraceae bacterium]|nr:hypothetical protein [Lachnospiraceae bacterium]